MASVSESMFQDSHVIFQDSHVTSAGKLERPTGLSRSLSFAKPKLFLFADGAKAFREISHNKMQYTKQVISRKPNQSKTCGTQVADVN